MKPKQKELMEAAATLFASKGFHATSIQEIVQHAGMSKGAFYNYFSSKEELISSLITYFSAKIATQFQEIAEKPASPAQTLRNQMIALYELITKNKQFIMMYFQEQHALHNEEHRKVMLEMQYRSMRWLKKHLLALYGDEAQPYVGDLILSFQGLQNSYLRIFIFDESLLTPEDLADFVLHSMDCLFANMKQKAIETLVAVDELDHLFSTLHYEHERSVMNQVVSKLHEMRDILHALPLPPARRQELQSVVNVLLAESEKKEPNVLIFQGMLATLKAVKALDSHRKELAKTLGIELL
ncbi:TetR family transcriptional regulator [Fictibacillus macauensis ZFHKF-1]|uniref:TetR family transcriptional regulator n=1 Tax=Fictibacillus macauensis ZFHKF-1 TaxID=1196324 RepID=I8UJT7_9BACL|nr:TetR/AcrR family transcriptional regulator [Fictibacillus macauensis]EIT87078.1 TetR family transcriptional regulator [Fictibacillus macauensis ZFHKF-1]